MMIASSYITFVKELEMISSTGSKVPIIGRVGRQIHDVIDKLYKRISSATNAIA